ncbi:MAG: D-glycero-beta-D-manno-heptose 1-phosphate adenylyltransferase [Pseudonocardiales bacterium]|nr:D-glycero-beta-D-manno-heptose 1-phosphate adenylyltransferase [Pseudonocardiales bacterium]MBV9029668.1 D-glycero-beta-D-manno-heptose 1-phosphate adenylyltransferase [Pseudonocardiales bacterium]MBW0008669.1 D-glycero-beta-D-manno-heptose 1-phosphate adenylyltransferase [Pseudonocardiales bacterium]
MTGSRLVVLGDSLLDSDVEGTVDRLCPDAPVPVVDVREQRWRPGGAGLAALLAARAGHDVLLVTALGVDPAARLLADLLAAHVEVVRMPLRGATVCKTRIRAAGRSLLRVDAGDGRAAGAPGRDGFTDVLCRAEAVLVCDYGRDVTADPTVREALVGLVRRVPVVWDPHPRGAPPVPGCRLVTPNETEAVSSLPRPAEARSTSTPAVGLAAAAALRARWRCDAVAITLGARGAALATAQGCSAVPVPEIEIPPDCDPCGAGDAFAAAVTGALLVTSSVRAAVAAAVHAASRFVADGGAASVSSPPTGSPPTGWAQSLGVSAVEVVARLRHRGGRLVATGGCFDLLHPGHLSLLRQARALGDALVVCVNSDESVRRRKGPGRPIVPAADRIALLKALEPVDAVIMFDEDTPTALLETLRPDLWVKGGDYTMDELPEASMVHRHGGQVVIIPLLGGYSTSRLVCAARSA